MLIERLIVHNFGVYKGRHEIDLRPGKNDQPIILFGGLNGRGKTTLINALQLALYGNQSRLSNRGAAGYGEYLRRSIHRGCGNDEGAAVGVEFRHVTEGQDTLYRVTRTWGGAGKQTTERVDVLVNGHTDKVLCEHWDQHIDTILPVRIAHLFFFDGEKIEGLADPKSSSEILSTAIHALLGLDLVDQLQTDLSALERRHRLKGSSESERDKSKHLEQQLNDVRKTKMNLAQERNGLLKQIQLVKDELSQAEADYATQGGVMFEQRADLEAARQDSESQVGQAKNALCDIAQGALPLTLVRNLVEEAAKSAQRERDAGTAEALQEVLESRDALLLEMIQTKKLNRKALEEVELFLTADRAERKPDPALERYLHLDPESVHQMRVLLDDELPESMARATSALAEYGVAVQGLEDADRALARIPEQHSLLPLEERRVNAMRALGAAEGALKSHDERFDLAVRSEERLTKQVADQLERVAIARLKTEDSSRLVSHSERARKTLKDFRLRVLERHIHQLELYVLESFQELLHKDRLVTELRIDPRTFAVTLRSSDEKEIGPGELSAGERQLLAVALLWGLAKAAGRKLPIVIDTPMGRLDSIHRKHLVEKYFPNASHQVILLSTDEEIDEGCLEALGDKIARVYQLEYDDEAQSTMVESGYFWEAA